MKATLSALAVLVLSMSGCTGRVDETASGHEEEEGWAVTAWGEHYEIFAEADPLVVGSVSKSHTHVTVLDGFPPLKQGSVAAILRDPQGREHAYRQESALRDGIYSIEIKPGSVGTFDLFFEVESAAGTERIAAGTVHVAEDDSAGGLVAAPRYGPDSTGFVPVGEPASFLKEQQWRIPFGTEWAHRGVVRRTVSGPARIRPAAGGEALLVAPVAGIVASTSGTFVGMDVGRNTTVIRLTPRVASDRSVAAIRSELGLARSRVKRLEELFEVEAVSVAELEEARARVRTLASEAAAAGGGTGEPIAVRSPLAGRVAELAVVPGQAVDAGDPLARIVRPNPLWIEVALSPADAGAVGSNLAGMVVRPPGNLPPVTLSQVRLVSRSPEVDRSTGSIALIVEARTGPPLSPGMAVTADVLLPNEREGIVLPATAVIDDGGVSVVYVQLDGESFVRQEVRVLATEGERVLVEGVAEWTRVVTLGGAAIRRAALLRSGPPEGHVH